MIPRPTEITIHKGRFALSAATTADGPPAALRRLRAVLGLPLPPAARPDIRLTCDDGLSTEEYRLTVSPGGVHLAAGATAGLLNGVHALAQLVPPGGAATALPCLRIADRPHFAWRGVLLDVARHVMPTPFVLRLLDLMALHRLNVLHLHLTDDQGWRLPVRRYPRLSTVGGARGGAYTAADIRAIVAHATERGITVVPEIDTPGHVQAALAAYPRLGNDPGRPPRVWDAWGVSGHVLNLEESTVDFFAEVLREVAALFPGPYVHLGGDECPTAEWAANARARERMRELGLTDVAQVPAWFQGRLCAVLSGLGRRAMCWDEPGRVPPPGAVVMPWRADGGVPAGYDAVFAPADRLYLDYRQSDAPGEPAAQQEITTLSDVYGYAPPEAAVRAAGGRLLGVECALWTEYMPTPRHVEYMAFPRLCAFAEVAWCGPDRDEADFRRRLPGTLRRLDALGVAYRPVDPLTDAA